MLNAYDHLCEPIFFSLKTWVKAGEVTTVEKRWLRNHRLFRQATPNFCVVIVCFNRCSHFRWQAWAPGIPKCIDAKTEADLPQDAHFSNEKNNDFDRSLDLA